MKSIQLRGKYSNFYTKVDDEDYEFLMQWKWMYNIKGYVVRSHRILKNGKRGMGAIIMHRLIMKAPNNMQVDHINHDRLDNRKENLRICSQKENIWNQLKSNKNKSGYKGVHFVEKTQRWSAQIRVNGKVLTLGQFDTARDAAIVYDLVARKYHKEFAALNII